MRKEDIMKKIIFFLIFLCSFVWSDSQCWSEYAPAIQYLEKKYIKYQIEYAKKNNTHFTYKYFPVTFFPLFCLPKNSVDLRGYVVWYLCDTLSVWKKTGHLKIAVLSSSGNNKRPSSKKYTLFSFYFNSVSKVWVEENPPLKVVLGLTNKERGYYGILEK